MPQLQKRQVLQDTSKILTPWRVSESCAVDPNRARISPDGSVLIKASSCSNSSSWQRETLQTEKLYLLLILLAHIFQMRTKVLFLRGLLSHITRQARPKTYIMSPLLPTAEDRYS